jgi:hypothetical protein
MRYKPKIGEDYRHAYQLIRDDILWRTVQHSFERLRLAVEEELQRLDEN